MEIACERRHKFTFLFASTVVHSLGFFVSSLATVARMYYSIITPGADYFTKFGYALKYVNTLNAVIQSIYHFVALTVDIMINASYTMDAPPMMVTARSIFRSSIAIPVGMFNATMYWIMTLKNPELLGAADYPAWLQHLLTTSSPILLFLDVICCKGESTNLAVALIVIAFLSMSYYVWLHIIYYFTKTWAVPFMTHYALPQKVALYFSFLLLKYVCFLIGWIVNDLLWCEEFVSSIPFLRHYFPANSRLVYRNVSPTSDNLGKLIIHSQSSFLERAYKAKAERKW
ncbi:uncharacterized protein LOC106674238 [Cimex lectularius]|uniref:Uncharacterized protein n=1 Tax=Cimex lectularius TaxID=79782 RepID=A0A8I6SDE1_CIMLE|nr:uncharacterized protein LOC106674238 [Cimex lectularius]